MTREEISKKIQSNQIMKESSRDWCESLVDSIVGDFKSRVCENCANHINIGKSFKLCNVLDINTPKDFGCNEFERVVK